METKNIINLLNDSSNENSCYRKWYVIDSQAANGKYNQSNSIKFQTESIKSSLYDYFDAFILVTGDKTAASGNGADLEFENYPPFPTGITEINDVFIDKANQTNITMPMYNLIECTDDYSDTLESLWQFKRDDVPANDADLAADNNGLFNS